MIKQIVHIVKKSTWRIDNDVIVVSNYKVVAEDINCLKYLDTNNCFENFIDIDNINNGDIISFELKLSELNSIGFFENRDSFIRKNRHCLLKSNYFILEIDCFQDTDSDFIISYGLIIHLIDIIKANSRHEFEDSDCQYSIIAKGDVSIVISYNYSLIDTELSYEQITALGEFISILNGKDEKQRLFLNELLEYVEKTPENERFRTIVNNIVELCANAEAAYLFYISEFSSQKLKIEINTHLLEFSHKVQAIINDAQAKLIAIPVATVFAVSSLDTSVLLSAKNIAVLISFLVFALLLHIFILNQQGGLKFLTRNVNNYEKELRAANTPILHSEFGALNSELKRQKDRLCLINCINWIIPGSIIFTWLILVLSKCTFLKLLMIFFYE